MMDTFVQIRDSLYPFGEAAEEGQTIKIADTQTFSCPRQLAEKKNEMVKKTKLIGSPYLVKLLKIYQEDLSLHYIYENVPFSLSSFLERQLSSGSQQILEMSKKLFLKKITYELAILIAYLVDMRIEIDLSVQNVGLTDNEKIKVFMSSRCRMGHKTEVSLIAYYSSRKEKILTQLQAQLAKIKPTGPPNFYIQGNKLVFPEGQSTQHHTEQYYPETPQPRIGSGSFGFDNIPIPDFSSQARSSLDTYDNIFYNPPNQGGTSIAKSLFSSKYEESSSRKTYNLGHNKSKKKRNKAEAFSANKQSKRQQKNSFHFGGSRQKEEPLDSDYDDNCDNKSFTHSKSVRIQFNQKVADKKKGRKDSYKVKITTFHEYEMDDCDPKTLFSNIPTNEEHIFDYFAAQGAHNQEEGHQETYEGEEEEVQEGQEGQKVQKMQEGQQEEVEEQTEEETEEVWEPQKMDLPKQSLEATGTATSLGRPLGQVKRSGKLTSFHRKDSLPQYMTSGGLPGKNSLQQKVQLAKKKAENVLSRYLNSRVRKSLSMNE